MTINRTAFLASLLGTVLIAGSAMAAQPSATGKPNSSDSVVPSPHAIISGLSSIFRPGATTALDGDRRALVNRISAYLSGVKTMVGDFVQVAPDGSRSKGHFFIQKPGRVRFEYDPPSPIDIVADGESVAVRDRKLDTQDVYPLSQTPLRFLLAPRIDLLKDTNVVGVYADNVFDTVVIEETQPLVGTNRLMMMFDAKDLSLKQWTVTDSQGFDTTVAISNVDTTKHPDPSLFRINYERGAIP
jgi:outer membrane lipoprotein-sorting protein